MNHRPIPSFRAALSLILVGLLAAFQTVGCKNSFDEGDISFLVTIRASLNSAGTEGHGDAVGTVYASADRPAISSDGRYVAFATKAEDLVSNDTNNKIDVYWRDMISGTTRLVSVNFAGTASGTGDSSFASISGDGRYVCFTSIAPDITANDGDILSDVFVRDMVNNTTDLVSRQPGPLGVKDLMFPSQNGRITTDGVYVYFESDSEELDGGVGIGPDTDNDTDIWRRQVIDATMTFANDLVSVSSAGVKGDFASLLPWPSADGRYVVWHSASTTLATTFPDGGPDANFPNFDVYWRDMLPGGRTRRVSLGDATIGPAFTIDPQGGPSDNAALSGDGFTVVFHCQGNNMVLQDPNSDSDNYSYNINSGITTIVTVHSTGAAAGNTCNFPTVSADGRLIAFQSQSSNLVSGDSNGASDVFIHDLVTHSTQRMSVATFGKEANGPSQHPVISADGKYVIFYSAANNLVDDDNNGSDDIFVRGAPFQ